MDNAVDMQWLEAATLEMKLLQQHNCLLPNSTVLVQRGEESLLTKASIHEVSAVKPNPKHKPSLRFTMPRSSKVMLIHAPSLCRHAG